jgi:hypothetical protein
MGITWVARGTSEIGIVSLTASVHVCPVAAVGESAFTILPVIADFAPVVPCDTFLTLSVTLVGLVTIWWEFPLRRILTHLVLRRKWTVEYKVVKRLAPETLFCIDTDRCSIQNRHVKHVIYGVIHERFSFR